MAAASATELAKGSPRQSANALAFTFKNLLGFVCNPVADLVEVICIKRKMKIPVVLLIGGYQ